MLQVQACAWPAPAQRIPTSWTPHRWLGLPFPFASKMPLPPGLGHCRRHRSRSCPQSALLLLSAPEPASSWTPLLVPLAWPPAGSPLTVFRPRRPGIVMPQEATCALRPAPPVSPRHSRERLCCPNLRCRLRSPSQPPPSAPPGPSQLPSAGCPLVLPERKSPLLRPSGDSSQAVSTPRATTVLATHRPYCPSATCGAVTSSPPAGTRSRWLGRGRQSCWEPPRQLWGTRVKSPPCGAREVSEATGSRAGTEIDSSQRPGSSPATLGPACCPVSTVQAHCESGSAPESSLLETFAVPSLLVLTSLDLPARRTGDTIRTVRLCGRVLQRWQAPALCPFGQPLPLPVTAPGMVTTRWLYSCVPSWAPEVCGPRCSVPKHLVQG